MATTNVDPAFVNAGQTEGLEIWRIEKLKVVPQEPTTFGVFYSGDSYIVLKTKKNGTRLEWDIHFWLGSTTTHDEQGIAAYKTVELDDYLGGAPVQHREVQDHESKLFMSYFKKGIKYLEGGIESGFKKVERDVYETRLLHIKGRRNVRVRQVKCDVSSLNQGDVFILDAGLTIYIWNGPSSSMMEKIKGAEVAKRIKDEERGGKAQIYIIDEKWDSDEKFFKALGSEGEISIKNEENGGDDREFERMEQENVKLMRVSDASGQLEIEEKGSKPLKRTDLDSNDCFILDSGPSGIFVWVGKNCTKNEKNSAWQNALEFLNQRGYPKWTPISSLVEGAETPLFKQYFSSWETEKLTDFSHVSPDEGSNIASSDEQFDVSELHSHPAPKCDGFMPDDGSGTVKIWRIENRERVAVPEDTYGVFYSGDCYILLYTYQKSNRDHYIIYFWQGNKSTIDERGASALLAQNLDDTELDGAAVQIRVVQGREPEHFLRLFKGKMLILMGGINNVIEETPLKMFHIRGTNDVNTRAVQVPCRCASLNSNDVFVVHDDSKLFVWIGKGASDDEVSVARNVVQFICPNREVTDVKEGEETEEFWGIVGEKEEYATGPRLESAQNGLPSRLFQCSNASGKFKLEEIINFDQEDLVEDDVMLLDASDAIFVWVGRGANHQEKKASLTAALEYIRTDPAGRTSDNTQIVQIKQGFEPPNFTGHFHAWDPEKWSHGKTYEELKKELGEENVATTTVEEELANFSKAYSYDELLKRTPPPGVDPTEKEAHLSDDDFKLVFKMSREEYLAKPQWKRTAMKKQVGLF
ncbi:hypothetical protein LOTGIDRAFT_221805 [Lottia gigantea]|uniref:HP domain-containing protein n=1 Tax=Lottia gigantea TaxID=225164 RepID=V3ZKU3_LOTGI|nr:hypothetical protein LOTGIDRAFT_221805 [Lottia gigantea]ESO84882.1 hypothetical protein LOTGIDRAFT_221805 [Lottia gigantea]